MPDADDLSAQVRAHVERRDEMIAGLLAQREAAQAVLMDIEELLVSLGHRAPKAPRSRYVEDHSPTATGTIADRIAVNLRGRGWVHASAVYAALGLPLGKQGGSTYVAMHRLINKGVVASRGRGPLRKVCLTEEMRVPNESEEQKP